MLGVAAGCQCFGSGDFPIALAPGQVRMVTFSLNHPKGRIDQDNELVGTLLLDSDTVRPAITLRYRLEENAPNNGSHEGPNR